MKFNSLIPELTVSDIDKTKDFYITKLGFNLEFERVEDKFIFLSFEGSQLMFEQFNQDAWNVAPLEYPYGRGINFEIGTSNVDALYKKVIEAGIKPYRELTTTVYRVADKDIPQKEFLIMDRDGYLLRFVAE